MALTNDLTVAIAGITVAVAASMGANAAYYAVNVDIVPHRAATALGIMDFAFAVAGFLAPGHHRLGAGPARLVRRRLSC